MLSRSRIIFSVFKAASKNRVLRRVGFGYALFGTAEFGTWISLLVFAFLHGGPTASTEIVLAQLVPCVILDPLLGALADRRRPSRVLFAGYGFQALSMGGVALAMGVAAPFFVVLVLSPLISISISLTRPPQAALLPAIVRQPDELTAANVMTGWTDGAAALAGPAIAGLLIAWQGVAVSVGADGIMALAAMFLVAKISGPAAAVESQDVEEPEVDHASEGSSVVSRSGVGRQLGPIWAGARSNVSLAVRKPRDRCRASHASKGATTFLRRPASVSR